MKSLNTKSQKNKRLKLKLVERLKYSSLETCCDLSSQRLSKNRLKIFLNWRGTDTKYVLKCQKRHKILTKINGLS